MRTLVIDTATQAMSLALFDDGVCVADVHEVVGRGHAERLLPAIAALPDGGRADRIAVDVGPGSFTGVRIGLAAARALALGWHAELTGYSALSIIAASVLKSHAPDAPFVVAMTGGHGELFWQRFDAATGEAIGPFASTAIAMLAIGIPDPICYGTGAPALIAVRGHGTAVDIGPQALAYPGLLLDQAILPASPLYGRGADAKPMTDPRAV